MGLEQMAINMARCNLDNALAIITSDEFRETGEYKLKGWQKLLEGGKEKYTRISLRLVSFAIILSKNFSNLYEIF